RRRQGEDRRDPGPGREKITASRHRRPEGRGLSRIGPAAEGGGKPMRPADMLPPSLAAGSAVRRLAAGETLFNQGDAAIAIFQVESGRLRLVRRTSDDHLVILYTARRGEFFAEASLFADTYHCDAAATAPS